MASKQWLAKLTLEEVLEGTQPEKHVTRASKTMTASQPKPTTRVKDAPSIRDRKQDAPNPSQLSVVDEQTIEDIDNVIESLAWLIPGKSIYVGKEGTIEKWIQEPAPQIDFNPQKKKRPTGFGRLQKIHQMSLSVFLNRQIDE